MSRWKLKWKIFLFLLGFCALLLAVLWIFQTVLLESFYKNIRVTEIKREAAAVAQNIDHSGLAEIVDAAAEYNDTVIDVTDGDGNSILSGPAAQAPRTAEENARFITRAAQEGGEFYEYFQLPPNPSQEINVNGSPRPGWASGRIAPMQSLVYVKLAERQTGEPAAVIVRAVISPVSATVATLRYQLYVVSGIMLFLSVILAIIIAKRVSRPIEEISRSAQTLAKGHYDTRFTGKGFSEIVALSNTLNTTAAELGRVEGFRRELLANVSHDLRTPLALIYSYAEMMNDFPDEITPEQMGVIMSETRRLSALVNDVLDISKMESNLERIDASRFNLTRNIAGTAGRLSELLRKENFDISFRYDRDVYVTADEAKIGQVFYNLLINAVNYSGESRKITITQTVADHRARISVTDGGEGILEAELPYIWERYYKSGQKHKRAVTGSGLGLSIVRGIMEKHGGCYGATSEPGKGSTFWFELKTE